MPAPAVARRQPGAVDRRAHQRLAHAFALFVEVADDTAGQSESVDLKGDAAELQRRVDHVAGPRRSAAFVLVLLVDHVEGVAPLNVALEIDIERIGADQLGDDRRRYSGPGGVDIKAPVHGAGRAHQPEGQFFLDHGGLEAVVPGPLHIDNLLGIGFEAEAEEPGRAAFRPVGHETKLDRLARHQFPWVVNLPQRHDGLVGLGPGNVRLDQQGHEGIALGGPDGAPFGPHGALPRGVEFGMGEDEVVGVDLLLEIRRQRFLGGGRGAAMADCSRRERRHGGEQSPTRRNPPRANKGDRPCQDWRQTSPSVLTGTVADTPIRRVTIMGTV